MAEIQSKVAQEISEGGIAVNSMGRRLTELRRSGAAGKHESRPRGSRTRHDQRNKSIRDSQEN